MLREQLRKAGIILLVFVNKGLIRVALPEEKEKSGRYLREVGESNGQKSLLNCELNI